jgi:hypothetical protein
MELEAIRTNPAYKEVPLDYIEFAEVDDIWVRAYSIAKAKTIIAQHVH